MGDCHRGKVFACRCFSSYKLRRWYFSSLIILRSFPRKSSCCRVEVPNWSFGRYKFRIYRRRRLDLLTDCSTVQFRSSLLPESGRVHQSIWSPFSSPCWVFFGHPPHHEVKWLTLCGLHILSDWEDTFLAQIVNITAHILHTNTLLCWSVLCR